MKSTSAIYLSDSLSYWEREHYTQDVEVTIIGAGIVGISTAIELKQMNPEIKVLIVDKKAAPVGASTRNAGFACFGSISEIVADIGDYGVYTCRKLIAMRYRGLQILKSRIQPQQMNYKSLPGIEIFDQEKEDYYRSKTKEINDFVQDVIHEEKCFNWQSGTFGNEVVNRLEGCLNPQKMMAYLELMARSLGVVFLSGIEVKKVDEITSELYTNRGILPYKKLVVCTNGFTPDIIDNIGVQPARNQVIVTKPVADFRLEGCYHMHEGYVYFREENQRLILGGGRHIDMENEATSNLGYSSKIINFLKALAEDKILKGRPFEIDGMWSGILGVGNDKMPIVDQPKDDIYYAIRMGGMGVAIGSYIGRVMASLILQNHNSETELYVRR